MLDIDTELRLRGLATFGSFERRIERLFRFIDYEYSNRRQTRSFTKNLKKTKSLLYKSRSSE